MISKISFTGRYSVTSKVKLNHIKKGKRSDKEKEQEDNLGKFQDLCLRYNENKKGTLVYFLPEEIKSGKKIEKILLVVPDEEDARVEQDLEFEGIKYKKIDKK